MHVAADNGSASNDRRRRRPLPSSRPLRGRRLSLRCAAIFAGILFVLAIEFTCRVTGAGQFPPGSDAGVEFVSVRPLFEKSSDGLLFQTASNRLRYFRRDSFPVIKPPGEFRIFVLGGSTVQGSPFSIETSFPACLQTALLEMDDAVAWKVVNCGGVSYATYRLLPILEECLRHDPDLIIFCEGHNEFLEDVTYALPRKLSPYVGGLVSVLDGSHLYRAMKRLSLTMRSADGENLRPATPIAAHHTGQEKKMTGDFGGWSKTGKIPLPEEVDTLLDHDGGLDAYHRDDEHARRVTENFRNNLTQMANLCHAHAVPFLLILPPSNLRDCPPFKPVFDESLSDQEKQQIHELLHQARERSVSDVAAAVQLAGQATRLDPRYALSWYELGHHLIVAGDFTAAETALLRARDEDVCPLRMVSTLEEAMRDVAKSLDVPMMNAHEYLSMDCQGHILGDKLLLDHVHPSFVGHQKIAMRIAEWMLKSQLAVERRVDWRDRMMTECRERIQSLDDMYFLRGQRSLYLLKQWAAGRSGGPPL